VGQYVRGRYWSSHYALYEYVSHEVESFPISTVNVTAHQHTMLTIGFQLLINHNQCTIIILPTVMLLIVYFNTILL
jgi:hypothetical protein